MQMSETVPSARVSKRFGGLQALSDVGITIRPGRVYGLIGPNGAGKTTFFNVITGLYTPDGGTFELGGAPTKPAAVHEVAEAGIARTFQNIRLFAEMTALENVMVGRHVRSQSGLGRGAAHRRLQGRGGRDRAQRARNCSTTWASGVRRVQGAHALLRRPAPPGDRARAGHRPKLIALDEPAAGMNATEKVVLRELIDRIRRDGRTILLIEHDVKLVMGLCDRVTVLDYGKADRRRHAADVQRNEKVIEAYLGAGTRRIEGRHGKHVAQVNGPEGGLRRHPGRQGRLVRGAGGRAGQPDRRQRRRQDDHAEGRHRPPAGGRRRRSSSWAAASRARAPGTWSRRAW